MQCYVYRSTRQQKMFLFLPRQGDFTEVPESLLALFGDAEFSFQFELTETRELVSADAAEVMRNIHENGFFLQLPPGDEIKMRC